MPHSAKYGKRFRSNVNYKIFYLFIYFKFLNIKRKNRDAMNKNLFAFTTLSLDFLKKMKSKQSLEIKKVLLIFTMSMQCNVCYIYFNELTEIGMVIGK